MNVNVQARREHQHKPLPEQQRHGRLGLSLSVSTLAGTAHDSVRMRDIGSLAFDLAFCYCTEAVDDFGLAFVACNCCNVTFAVGFLSPV